MLLMNGVAQQTQDKNLDDSDISSQSDPSSASDCSSAAPSLNDGFHLPAENLHGAMLSMDDNFSAQACADAFLPQGHLSLENTSYLGFPVNVPEDVPKYMDMTEQSHGEAGLTKSGGFIFDQTEAFSTTNMSPSSFDIAPPELLDEL